MPEAKRKREREREREREGEREGERGGGEGGGGVGCQVSAGKLGNDSNHGLSVVSQQGNCLKHSVRCC